MSARTIIPLVLMVVVVRGDECGRDKNGAFPWNVGIYLENQNEAELLCLGTVIQPNTVLTAAHCFCDILRENFRNGTFYVMTDNLPKKINTKSQPTNLHKINKDSIRIHKHYKGIGNFFENDLAIIKSKFHFGTSVTPVCVDWGSDINDSNLPGKQPIWSDNKITSVDHESSYDCHDGSTPFLPFVTSDKLCSKLKTSGTQLTHQSEGAALVFSYSDRWYIKGVISMHDVTNGQFSTYSNTRQYINWISNNSI